MCMTWETIHTYGKTWHTCNWDNKAIYTSPQRLSDDGDGSLTPPGKIGQRKAFQIWGRVGRGEGKSQKKII